MKDLLLLGVFGFGAWYVYEHYLKGSSASGGASLPPVGPTGILTPNPNTTSSSNPMQLTIQPVGGAGPVDVGTATLLPAPSFSTSGGGYQLQQQPLMMTYATQGLTYPATYSGVKGLGTYGYMYPMTRWAA